MASKMWLDHPDVKRREFSNPQNLIWRVQPNKILLHTTEGFGIPSAAVYRNGQSAPHFTLDPKNRVGQQHYPYTEAAWALRAPAGISTNTVGPIQIEIVGTCDPAQRRRMYWVPDMPQADLEWLAGVLKGIADDLDIPIQSSVNWVAYPKSYGRLASQRLSASAFAQYRGLIGHQHAPGNTHGDPGAFPIARLMEAMGGKGSSGGSKPKPPTESKPKPDNDDEYPAIPLLVDGHWGGRTTRALQIVLPKSYNGGKNLLPDGVFGVVSKKAAQRWLKKLGHYKGAIDGKWGQMSVKALQSFLYDKGLYRNGSYPKSVMVDGQFGERSVKALQRYLNDQRKYL